ncbi:MAG: 3-hydroxyacyl-CoA dehydrogenase family protein [Candidatus Lokiarchaeota archaeon]|nr:3-hydroxyacyl-CoA dehydrogenase family protein [Candidatus Lokiarchaeota archaeon]
MNINDIKHVMVVGAGTMGHSIAQVYAQSGYDVDLVDLKQELLDKAKNKIKFNLSLLAEYQRVPSKEIPSIINRINLSTDLEIIAKKADYVVEAVSEDRNIKREVYSQLDEFCSHKIIFASNTSELNIFNIVDVSNPERLVIQHWFRPPHIIPLVEIVAGKKTSPEIIDLSRNILKKLGKTPIVLKKFTNAFIVNKIQQAINSAVFGLLLKGIATPEEIDLAVKTSFSLRLPVVGVVQNLDFVGLDVISDVLKNMGLELSIIKDKVDQGHYGVKTSKGLFDYSGRSEEQILRKKDEKYLEILKFLEKLDVFEPV